MHLSDCSRVRSSWLFNQLRIETAASRLLTEANGLWLSISAQSGSLKGCLDRHRSLFLAGRLTPKRVLGRTRAYQQSPDESRRTITVFSWLPVLCAPTRAIQTPLRCGPNTKIKAVLTSRAHAGREALSFRVGTRLPCFRIHLHVLLDPWPPQTLQGDREGEDP
jgi:hypothetical protein